MQVFNTEQLTDLESVLVKTGELLREQERLKELRRATVKQLDAIEDKIKSLTSNRDKLIEEAQRRAING